jgi:hypothetical protein
VGCGLSGGRFVIDGIPGALELEKSLATVNFAVWVSQCQFGGVRLRGGWDYSFSLYCRLFRFCSTTAVVCILMLYFDLLAEWSAKKDSLRMHWYHA